ncbi:hypothetical protein ABZ732_08790 [Streptomyces pseudogriseolus]|uniref:hypothetical protein n=1 Tax=Streptomyces pseudogriseolus TaxID=36817 RepID=UPI0034894D0D
MTRSLFPAKHLIPKIIALVAMIFGMSFVFSTTASAHPLPPGAKAPVRTYDSSVTTERLSVNSACVDFKDNPVGYVTIKTTYRGHSYIDARGVHFGGLYQTWTKAGGFKGVSGPHTVHSKSVSHVCGVP